MTDVFLCHNSADSGPVESLAKRLEYEGISVWLDTFNLIAGERFTPAIEKALDDCGTIAVFVGQMGRGPYQNEEFDYAVNVRGTQGTRIIPVLLPGAAQEMITGLLRNRPRVQFHESLDEIEPFRMLVGGIRNLPPRRVELKSDQAGAAPFALPEVPSALGCPYRPLAAFDVADHAYFCGRDRLTAETVSRIEAVLGDSTRCFSIVGASGSGKSSLARAGVLWSLQQKHPDWVTVILQPGTRPHDSLAERMLKLTQDQVDGLTLKTHGEAYLSDAAMLQRSIAGALGNDISKGRLILFVDQFEEVFTICESDQARKAFIANLMAAARYSSGKAVVLLCLRADFYEDCAKTELAEVLSKAQILVGPMRPDELRSAIRDPAVRAGSDVEPALVTSLVKDCEDQPSPLPLLQIALEKLWQKRDQRQLTLAEYEKMSLAGAINEHAEAVYDKLLDAQKKTCQSLMLQLTEPLDDGRYTRRRVTVDSLLPSTDRKNERSFARVKQVETVLGLLSGQSARLITIRLDGGVSKVEVSHEAIFRGWKRLASWLDQDNEFLAWKRRLRFEVADSNDPKTRVNYLSGGVLDRAQTWLRERPDDHNELERRFIETSSLRRMIRRGSAAALLLAAAGLAAIGFYWLQNQRRIDETLAAAYEQMKAHPDVALLLAYDAAKHEKSSRTREMLQRAVQNGRTPLLETEGVTDLAFSRDGKVLAAASDAIKIWSPSSNSKMSWAPALIGGADELPFKGTGTRIAISPNAEWIAAGDDEGDITIWRDKKQAGTPFSLHAKIHAVDIADDGHLAISTENRQVIWWNAATAKEDARVSADHDAWAIAVSPDSTTVAVGLLGLVRFWKPPADWRDGLHHDETRNPVNMVTYSSDGAFIGSNTNLGSAARWYVNGPPRVTKLPMGQELVRSMAMDASGGRIAVLTTEGSLTVWNAGTGKLETRIEDQSRDAFKIAINAAGTIISTAAPNGIRIYELRDEAVAALARTYLKDYQVDEQTCGRISLKRANCEEDLRESK